MSLISLVDASKDFGIRTLFADLTLHIREGDRLGLIGPNGSGKSTLLKVLAGEEPLGGGERRCSSRLRVELVGQESSVDPGLTVLEQVLAGCGEKRDLLLRFSELSEAVADNPDNAVLLAELGVLSQRMDESEAWSLEQQCQEVLQRLGITDLHSPVEALSGGYRKRVGLASALVACPDVLLLDEPTNHLDAAAVEWLQSWLDRYPGALVLVTHDRYVLDRVTRRIVEVELGKHAVLTAITALICSEKPNKISPMQLVLPNSKACSDANWLGYAKGQRPAAPNKKRGCNASTRCRVRQRNKVAASWRWQV